MSAYVDQHRERFRVEPICRTLDVSPSAYHQRATGERSARQVKDERLVAVIRQMRKQNYEAYGYRRMWKALERAGEHAPRCQVQRLDLQMPPVASRLDAMMATMMLLRRTEG